MKWDWKDFGLSAKKGFEIGAKRCGLLSGGGLLVSIATASYVGSVIGSNARGAQVENDIRRLEETNQCLQDINFAETVVRQAGMRALSDSDKAYEDALRCAVDIANKELEINSYRMKLNRLSDDWIELEIQESECFADIEIGD